MAKPSKVVFGAKQTINALKNGKVKKVIIADNLPKDLKEDILYYSKLADVPVEEFNGTSKDLAIKYGRAHPILVVAELK